MAAAPSGWSARQGLVTASSVTLAVLTGALLGLPDLWWAAISAWIVANPDFGALWRKLAMRIAGTAAGLLIGLNVALLTEGYPPFQALVLFAAGGIGTYQRFSHRYGYGWFYAALTISMMIAVSITAPNTLFSFAQFRFIEIVLGVGVTAFVHALARPQYFSAAPLAAPRSSDPGLVQVGLVGGFSVVGMTALWSTFDIPALPQTLISTLALLDRDYATIRVRARQRFLGCLLGAVLGLLCLLLQFNALGPYLAVLFAGIFYFSRLHHSGGPQAYIGTQGGVAFITAMVTGGGPPASVIPALNRLAGVFVGVAMMLAVSVVLAALATPRRPAPASPSAIGDAADIAG